MNTKQLWHVAVIRKSDKTAIMQIRQDKNCLSPDILAYIGSWYCDVTPLSQFMRNDWRLDFNKALGTNFTRLVIDSDTPSK